MATAEATGTGISFALTDEQKALRELAHEFAAKEIRPVAAEYDEHQTHPADVLANAHEVGLMNPHVPEELGGAGLGAMDGALIGEELCWGCSWIGTSIVANILGALPMLIAGTEEQRREWLPPLLEEPILCSFALTEANARLRRVRHQTTAVPRRRVRHQRLEDVHHQRGPGLVGDRLASTDKDAGHRGLSAFIVPTELDGVVVEKHLDKMGRARRTPRRSRSGRGGARGPPAQEGGPGLQIAMQTLDNTRPGTAAAGASASRGRLEHSVSTRASACSSASRSR
jgi:acyl-CoA dehydrogenase